MQSWEFFALRYKSTLVVKQPLPFVKASYLNETYKTKCHVTIRLKFSGIRAFKSTVAKLAGVQLIEFTIDEKKGRWRGLQKV